MYEVFNWGHVNESRPKRLSLFLGASEINIDDPPPPSSSTQTPKYATNSRSYGETFFLIKHTHSHFINAHIRIYDAYVRKHAQRVEKIATDLRDYKLFSSLIIS